jgi:mannose-6-phosphate isomerase-like protein (cupin superfamily)
MIYKQSKPWGYFEVIGDGPNHKTKQLVVMPDQATSLQKHNHRAEHWVVVAGEVNVVLNTLEKTLGVNESIYIPKGARHRISNYGDRPAVIVEVQVGDITDEEDIQRIEDKYGRTTRVDSEQ